MNSAEQIRHECLAATKQCVFFDHSRYAILEVRGKDRISFLHHILAGDIQSLTPGHGLYTCLLNAQAKVLLDMYVLGFDEFLWLGLEFKWKEKALERLRALIISEQVELLDRSDDLKLISIHGPKARELAERFVGREKTPRGLYDHFPVVIDGINATLIRIHTTGEEDFGFVVTQEDRMPLKASLIKQGDPFRLEEIHKDALEVIRIRAGIPRYGIDFDENTLLPETGLDHAASQTKGCFPGQEILARLDSRGGLSKKLMGLELKGETIPKKNDLITKDGQEVGFVTSATFSSVLKKTVAIGYLKKECWEIGSPVVVEAKNARIPARVANLPFYTPTPKSA